MSDTRRFLKRLRSRARNWLVADRVAWHPLAVRMRILYAFEMRGAADLDRVRSLCVSWRNNKRTYMNSRMLSTTVASPDSARATSGRNAVCHMRISPRACTLVLFAYHTLTIPIVK